MNGRPFNFFRGFLTRRWFFGPLRWVTALAAVLPIAAVGLYSLSETQAALNKSVISENGATATLTAETLKARLAGDVALARTIASFPTLQDSVRRHDRQGVQDRLQRLIEQNPDIDRAFVLDEQGVLWSDWPIAPESLGRNFSDRDYFRGVMNTGMPYVSEVFQRVAEPRPLVIAIATPLRIDGQLRGTLVFQHRTDTIRRWLDISRKAAKKDVVVLDQRGVVAAHADIPVSGTKESRYADLDQVNQARDGNLVTEEYTDPLTGRLMIATFAPVIVNSQAGDGSDRQTNRWVVISQQDRKEAYASVRTLRLQILLASALVGSLAFSAMWFIGQATERHRRAELELAAKNAELQQAIARQERAQAELAQERNLFHTLMDNLPDRIYFKDKESRFLRVNRAMLTLFKAPGAGDALGKTDFDYFDRAHALEARNDEYRVMAEGVPLVGKIEHECFADGRSYWVSTTKLPLYDHQGQIAGTFGISRDVTVLKRMEDELRRSNAEIGQRNEQLQKANAEQQRAHRALQEAQGQLIQSAKLAGIGQMVAGVAHEINNPLSFVSNNVAVLQRDVAAVQQLLELYRSADPMLEKQNPELLAEIRGLADQVDLGYLLSNLQGVLARSRDGLRRIAQIVKDLRDFARTDDTGVHESDLNAGIESTIGILHAKARKKDVSLALQLATIPPVTCNLGKINQVIMNLVANAIDASPTGATVEVRSGEAGGIVSVEVVDHGTGISPEHREHLFEPFFTTKAQGEGVGLGLSISYGIVQSHGGTITVDTTPGSGSRFVVMLPCAPKNAAPPVAAAHE